MTLQLHNFATGQRNKKAEPHNWHFATSIKSKYFVLLTDLPRKTSTPALPDGGKDSQN